VEVRKGVPEDEKGERGFFIITGKFSVAALTWCKDKPIELIDRSNLSRFISKG